MEFSRGGNTGDYVSSSRKKSRRDGGVQHGVLRSGITYPTKKKVPQGTVEPSPGFQPRVLYPPRIKPCKGVGRHLPDTDENV